MYIVERKSNCLKKLCRQRCLPYDHCFSCCSCLHHHSRRVPQSPQGKTNCDGQLPRSADKPQQPQPLQQGGPPEASTLTPKEVTRARREPMLLLLPLQKLPLKLQPDKQLPPGNERQHGPGSAGRTQPC